jgi:hypothetical protein
MKRSILGILGLVVAAGAGFGVHQYLQGQHGLLLPWISEIMGPAEVAVCEQPSLEMIETKTKELLQLSASKDRLEANQHAFSLLEQVDRAHSALVAQAQGDQTRWRQICTAVLHAKFAGARVEPDRFVVPFREFADRLIQEHPNSWAASQAAMLQSLVKYDPRCPVTQDVLVRLHDDAATHSETQGVRLFCLFARELVRNGHAESAEAVLRHGVRTYQTTPAAGTLVTQMIDLGFSEAPRSELTQTDWNLMTRAIEAQNSNGTQTACEVGPRLQRT